MLTMHCMVYFLIPSLYSAAFFLYVSLVKKKYIMHLREKNASEWRLRTCVYTCIQSIFIYTNITIVFTAPSDISYFLGTIAIRFTEFICMFCKHLQICFSVLRCLLPTFLIYILGPFCQSPACPFCRERRVLARLV